MITQLNVHHLRNLDALSMRPTSCNLIIGDNGSGKTSLIEAIYLLARGKSFRHYQPKRYISHGTPTVTIHAKFDDDSSMAIQKSIDATAIMRINHQTVYVQSLLTKRLPTLLIDPSSMDMLEVGSSSRRQLLDWIVFHVKPKFHSQWLAYQRLLKQRNTLLRSCNTLTQYQRQEIMAWDKGLASHANLITHYRKQIFDLWSDKFNEFISKLLPEYAPHIKLRFAAGYDTNSELNQLLKARIEQDCQMGYTRIGCHRSDVQILWVEEKEVTAGVASQSSVQGAHKLTTSIKDQAANILSRGEKKLLITALKLSQLAVLISNREQSITSGQEQPQPIVLLDDIAAELDTNALTLMLSALAQLPCQVFITNLDNSIQAELLNHWSKFAMFHMKQGAISDSQTITK